MVKDSKHDTKTKATSKETEQGVYCRYCGRKMNPFDFKTFHGICGKCRETMDWKEILEQLK